MDVVDRLYSGYGEGAPQGQGPRQDRLQSEGETYLARDFPDLDRIERVTIDADADST
jgi:peptidyl-prolyl cis-trans isomerase A (cyclophilin A)